MTQALVIQPVTTEDRERVARFIEEHWGSRIVVGHGAVYEPHRLPGLAAWRGRKHRQPMGQRHPAAVSSRGSRHRSSAG